MTNNPRDTQFQGFAHALLLQLAEENALALNWDRFFGDLELTVARRAYDLATHASTHFDDHACSLLGFEETLHLIPDMTELPKEPLSEDVKQAAIQIARALEPPRGYDNFGRIITFSEGPEPPKEQE